MEKRKVNSPIYFINAVKQPVGNAIELLHNTDDPRLINHVVPECVTDVETYLNNCSYVLDCMEERKKPFIQAVQTTEIVKGKNSIFKPGMVNQEDTAVNFKIVPLRRFIFKNRRGHELYDREEFECQLIFYSGESYNFMLRTCEISSMVKMIRKRYSQAIVYIPVVDAQRKLEIDFREKTSNISTVTVLVEAGWQDLNGYKVYLHDEVSLPKNYITMTGLSLPFVEANHEMCKEIYARSLKISYNINVAHTLSLFSFTGILYRCFKEAGYPPRFLLFMNGRTGSFKTAIAKILFIQLCDEKYRDTPRRIDTDTKASIDRGIVCSGVDTITLFDDFSPAKTQQGKNLLNDNLEFLIRMGGDGSTKSRANTKLEDVRGEGVQGMIAVTGELQGKGVSSKLRCLYVHLERDEGNTEILSWFQANMKAYPTLLNYFAKYVAKYWSQIVHLIKCEIPNLRKSLANHIEERRLADSAAMLYIVAEILKGFLVEGCGINSNEAETNVASMKNSVLVTAIESMHESRDESYSLVFLKTIHELLQMQVISFCSGKPEDSNKLNVFAGYYDESFYYLYLPACYPAVRKYLKSTNRDLFLEPDEIAKELFQDGLSIASTNGKKTDGTPRLYRYLRVDISGIKGKVNFIKIKKTVFEAVVNCQNVEEFREKFEGVMECKN